MKALALGLVCVIATAAPVISSAYEARNITTRQLLLIMIIEAIAVMVMLS